MKVGDKVQLISDKYFYEEYVGQIFTVESVEKKYVHLINGSGASQFYNYEWGTDCIKLIPEPLNIGERLMEITGANQVQSARFNEGKIQTREIDPAFILGIGEVLTKSRAKYDHYNWCKPTKLSTPYESLMRHLMAFQSGENFDKETESHHLLHAATNLMFMYYHCMNNPEESDDRFFKKKEKK